MGKRSEWDRVRKVIHGSGITWWTPLVGKQDQADLEYLRSSILRDLEWVSGFDETATSASLQRVEKDLRSLLEPVAGARFEPVKYAWHVPSGWTDYGGIRLGLLAALPVEAHEAALAELRSMEALVLSGSRTRWRAVAADLESDIANPATAHDPTIPQRLCALWREVDFGRNYWRVRTAKNTTITALTWSLILAATITVLIIINSGSVRECRPGGCDPNVWLVALLGLLGGSMSALRSTDLISGERKPIEIEAARVRLRPVVGAAMAVVIYVIGKSGIAFELITTASSDVAKTIADAAKAAADAERNAPVVAKILAEAARTLAESTSGTSQAPIQIRVPDIAWGYYALAFVAGFAERWFLKIIDLVEGRTDAPPTPPPATKDGSKPVSNDPPPPTDPTKDAAIKADAAKAAVEHAATAKVALAKAIADRDEAITQADTAAKLAKEAVEKAKSADATSKDGAQKDADAKQQAALAAAAKAETARKAAVKAQAASDAAERDVKDKQAAAADAATKAAAAKAISAKANDVSQAKDAAAKVAAAKTAWKAADEAAKQALTDATSAEAASKTAAEKAVHGDDAAKAAAKTAQETARKATEASAAANTKAATLKAALDKAEAVKDALAKAEAAKDEAAKAARDADD